MRIVTALLCAVCFGGEVYGGREDLQWEISPTTMLTSARKLAAVWQRWHIGAQRAKTSAGDGGVPFNIASSSRSRFLGALRSSDVMVRTEDGSRDPRTLSRVRVIDRPRTPGADGGGCSSYRTCAFPGASTPPRRCRGRPQCPLHRLCHGLAPREVGNPLG